VRRVEVRNGVRTEPFRIKRLLHCLQLTCDCQPAPVAVRPQFVIWFVGDSTIIQLLHAFFCALIRIGGDVQQCHSQRRTHYEHPACVVHPLGWSKTTGYAWTASVEVSGTVYVLKLFPESIFDDDVSLMLGGCSTDGSGDHDDCPDLVIVNKGVHFIKSATFERDTTAFMSQVFDLPEPVLSRTVWRETMIQHFPGDDGLYEHRQAATKCAETSNLSTETVLHRQHTTHSVMLKLARARGVSPIPFVSLESIEANSGYLFPWMNGYNKQGAPNLDCTHRIYTPLYYDAVFSAFADTLCGYI
jgi:hypothetical protein